MKNQKPYQLKQWNGRRRFCLFNFGTFYGAFYLKKQALDEIKEIIGEKDFPRWREYFDIVRGDVSIKTENPFRSWSKR